MARSFTFNGQTRLTPGAISRVTAVGLTPAGLSTNGIIGLIGEADGGTPGEVVIVDDPVAGLEAFRSGPLADAIKIAFDPSADPRIPGGAFRCVCYKTNQGTQSSTILPTAVANATGAAIGGSTAAVIDWSGSPVLTTNSMVGMWMTIGSESRRIVSNAAAQATVSPPFSTAPPATTSFSIMKAGMEVTSRDYGTHTNAISVEVEAGVGTGTSVITVSDGTRTQQSPDLGGKIFLEAIYTGGPVPLQGVAGASASGLTVTAATTTTVDATFSTAPTASQYVGYIIEFSGGIRRRILSHTAATNCVITLHGTTPLSAAEAVDVVGQTFTIRAVTAATASITGSAGVATGFTTTVTMVPVSALDNLSLTFAEGETLRQFVTRVNATSSYLLEVPDGINQDTTLMASFDFGTRATAVDVRYDHEVSYQDQGTFLRDLQAAVDWINDNSELISAERGAIGGGQMPAVTGGVTATLRDEAVYLVSGTRGTSTNTNFQNGFDEMLLNRVNHVVPLISYDLADDGYGSTATFASVAAQAASFVDEANSGSANECGVYLGMDGTETQLHAQAASLNNPNVQLTGQKFTILDTTNSLVEKPEWSSAVNAAGMRAGAADVGEPLTFKKCKTTALSNDSSWSTKDKTDRNGMIESGILFAETAPNGGFRWVRDITTYLTDDNIVYLEGSTRDACRYLVYNLRTAIEEKFTGERAGAERSPATVPSIREFVSNFLTQYWKAGILVSSNDPENPESTTVIPGWRRLKVSISGNVANIKAEVFVVTGLVFEGLDIYVQVPQLS